MLQLFYLDNSRKIHLRGVRARWSERREEHPIARSRGVGGVGRAYTFVGERENPLAPFFICFFLHPGPVLCKLGCAVLPEVLTPVLGPSFDLPLFYFCGLFPSLSFSHCHLDSFSLFYLPNITISSSAAPLLLLPSILPSIRVFSNELTLSTGGQSIGASASASVLPGNIQGWFPLGLTRLISLLSKGHSRVLSTTILHQCRIPQWKTSTTNTHSDRKGFHSVEQRNLNKKIHTVWFYLYHQWKINQSI